jgi:hypothetical protein
MGELMGVVQRGTANIPRYDIRNQPISKASRRIGGEISEDDTELLIVAMK